MEEISENRVRQSCQPIFDLLTSYYGETSLSEQVLEKQAEDISKHPLFNALIHEAFLEGLRAMGRNEKSNESRNALMTNWQRRFDSIYIRLDFDEQLRLLHNALYKNEFKGCLYADSLSMMDYLLQKSSRCFKLNWQGTGLSSEVMKVILAYINFAMHQEGENNKLFSQKDEIRSKKTILILIFASIDSHHPIYRCFRDTLVLEKQTNQQQKRPSNRK